MRFCPYCGMKLSERSKFCSQCGKASSPRQRSSAVAVEEASAETDAHESRASELHAVDKPRSKATARTAEHGPRVEQAGELASVERGRVKTSDSTGVKRSTNGSSATRSVIRDRRFAPPTHSLVGALEQAVRTALRRVDVRFPDNIDRHYDIHFRSNGCKPSVRRRL